MKLSEIKAQLPRLKQLKFELPDGTSVPKHFHVTEVGIITKHFIDCGGKERLEKVANFQLWDADDYDHRLEPTKLLNIIKLSERVLGMEDLEIEVEYQADTIGKYGLAFDGEHFQLTAKQTDCLAKDKCEVPKPKIQLVQVGSSNTSCTPGGGCC